MKIKVCGMKYISNIASLSTLEVDFMGMIFYPKSPRYIENLVPEELTSLPIQLKKVGVFVNADIHFIRQKVDTYKLDYLQLHGHESESYCSDIKQEFGLPIIKAFNVSDIEDFKATEQYNTVCDYYLFDTKTSQHGGSGLKFDWSILNEYKGDKPFFLSGGISAQDADAIKRIKHPRLYALDLNSKFEVEAGLKNIELLDQFIKEIKR